ncbi:MAG: hypothetical protein K6V73_07720 [Firmicutes bacterium]|nr:hypothetical protein [Bacillota bacterium]
MISQGIPQTLCQLVSVTAHPDGWNVVFDVGALTKKLREVVVGRDGVIREVNALTDD